MFGVGPSDELNNVRRYRTGSGSDRVDLPPKGFQLHQVYLLIQHLIKQFLHEWEIPILPLALAFADSQAVAFATMPRDFQFRDVPFGFLITFRGHGTWLHGDPRGSVDRFRNRYGSPRIPVDDRWRKYNQSQLKAPPVHLGKRRREMVMEAVRDTCKKRRWTLWATNVRSNHVHSVVTAPCDAEVVLNALKANATRKLREEREWLSNRSPWAERGSKKHLWTEKALNNAIAYVENEQGEPLP